MSSCVFYINYELFNQNVELVSDVFSTRSDYFQAVCVGLWANGFSEMVDVSGQRWHNIKSSSVFPFDPLRHIQDEINHRFQPLQYRNASHSLMTSTWLMACWLFGHVQTIIDSICQSWFTADCRRENNREIKECLSACVIMYKSRAFTVHMCWDVPVILYIITSIMCLNTQENIDGNHIW